MPPWRIVFGEHETAAAYEPPAQQEAAAFLFAHGAGGSANDRGMTAASEALRRCGIGTVRFDFPYRARNRRRPDPMPVLVACVRAVADRARRELRPRRLVIGGRSMGGRAASLLAAEGYGCDGLLLLAYPLHPARQPAKLRDAHLARIAVPVLCLNGTRDALCERELMERAIRGLAGWTMHWIEGADHSFRVPKVSGRSQRDVLEEAGDAAALWIARL